MSNGIQLHKNDRNLNGASQRKFIEAMQLVT